MRNFDLPARSDLDAAIYALTNGYGKGRANQLGYARSVSRWRVMGLSSGEVSSETQLAQGGFNVRAGQVLRFLDLPTVGAYGAFDDLHSFQSGAAFSDSLREAAAQHYGHAGPLFIRCLIRRGEDLPKRLSELLPSFSGSNDMQRRVGRIFAIIALAGELALSWRILPWPKNTALDACMLLFDYWRDHAQKSAASSPQKKILAALVKFLDLQSDSRFSPLHGDTVPVRDRAGYWDDVAIPGQKDTRRIYFFTSTGLREATKGYDFNLVLEALEQVGAFFRKDKAQIAVVTDTPKGKQRLYHIDPTKLE